MAFAATAHPALRPHPLAWTSNARADKYSLLPYALATAFIYGICGYGPLGPAPQFAGADLMSGPSCEISLFSTKKGRR